ncbi:SCO6745 family protein [Streptomyces cinereoruber]|uniref:SCO6745 family protein n=1 Tax=Streptomyces cinereoruber TaxID=67260 RepID=UPI0036431BA6
MSRVLDPVAVSNSRRSWTALEAYTSSVYLTPEMEAVYGDLGVSRAAGFIASRLASLGRPSTEVAISSFYTFSPAIIGTEYSGVWDKITPTQAIDARLTIADRALRRILGNRIDSPDVEFAASIAKSLALAAAERAGGRVIFAAHSTLPWPQEPHLVLWHAQLLLREYRGDGHTALLIASGISGAEAVVSHAAGDAGVDSRHLRLSRGWSDDIWHDAVRSLSQRGLVHDKPTLALTTAGKEWRTELERATDELSCAPFGEIGNAACRELQRISARLSIDVARQAMPWLVSEIEELLPT